MKTITSITWHNGEQFVEFTSAINSELLTIQGPFVDAKDQPTNELVLVYQECIDDSSVHDVYVIY